MLLTYKSNTYEYAFTATYRQVIDTFNEGNHPEFVYIYLQITIVLQTPLFNLGTIFGDG